MKNLKQEVWLKIIKNAITKWKKTGNIVDAKAITIWMGAAAKIVPEIFNETR